MQCSICLLNFNATNRKPFDVCSNRHCYCENCIKVLLEQTATPKCPECRQPIRRREVVLNRTAHGILREIETGDCTNIAIEPPKSIEEGVLQAPSQAAQASFKIPLYWFKMVLLAVFGWTVPIVTWVYLFNLGGYFQIALAYFVCFRFYQLIRNQSQFQDGKVRLLLKLGLFGMIEEIDKGEVFFYVQFALKWAGTIIGIALLHSYYGYNWTPLSIATLILNIMSVGEIIVGRLYMKRLLDYALQPGYEWLPSITLVTMLLLGLMSCLTNLIHLGVSWPPSVAIYLVLWVATFIFYLVKSKSKTCLGGCATGLLTTVSFAYSIGMFFWMAVRNCINRVPIYVLMLIRYLVCPLVSLILLVLPSKLEQEHCQLIIVGQLLSTMELGLGIYLISR